MALLNDNGVPVDLRKIDKDWFEKLNDRQLTVVFSEGLNSLNLFDLSNRFSFADEKTSS